MKKIILPILLVLVFNNINAQNSCETPVRHLIKSNRIAAYVYNDGTLFNDVDGQGGFRFPYTGEGSPSVMGNAVLWLGGFAFDDLTTAAGAFGNGGRSDFAPGPLNPETALPYTDFPCELFNKIWMVTGEEIRDFLDDWNDNKNIDENHLSIFLWPGNGNPHFYIDSLPNTKQGWAPFFDRNHDDIYDPLEGDFPLPEGPYDVTNFIPSELTWTVFHDNTSHVLSVGLPIKMEVQQTVWTRHCENQPEIANTVFVDYKLINRNVEDISEFHAGIVADFDIGCSRDDYIGSIPSRNAFYGYNFRSIDGGCPLDTPPFGNQPPGVSVSFAHTKYGGVLDHFIHFAGSGIEDPPIGQSSPGSPVEFYRYLTGIWRDGTPLTFGGSGYDPNSNDFTDYAFIGNPNNEGEWSMLETLAPNFDYRVVGSTGFSKHWQNFPGSSLTIRPNESVGLSVAFTCHRDAAYDHITIINKMINDDLKNLELAYFDETGINGPYCQNFTIEEPNEEEEEEPAFIAGIYPNPTSDKITIAIPEETIEEVAVFNTAWQLLYMDDEPVEEIQIVDLDGFAAGLYFVRINVNGTTLFRRVVVN